MDRAIFKAAAAASLCMAALAPRASEAKTVGQRIHDLPAKEWVYQGLNLADKAITAECIHSANICEEGNPLLGRRPSTAKLMGAAVIQGAAHAAFTTALQDYRPDLVDRWENLSLVIGVGVIGWNLHMRF